MQETNPHQADVQTSRYNLRLACDAAVTTIIEDDAGHPSNVGRKTSVIPTAIKHWGDGGETRLDNLVTLCRNHHTRLHQGEYRIVAKGNEIHFISSSNNAR